MNSYEMVAAIVIACCITIVLRAKYKYMADSGIIEDKDGNKKPLNSHDNKQQLLEVKELKQRVQTLERIATDNNKAIDLDREIEQLRSK